MMQKYQEKLNTLGQKIIDADFVMILLTSLPELWNTFIGVIEITNQMKSTDIIVCILQKDCRQTRGSESSNQMLAEKGRFHKSSEARDMLKIYCKKPGHFKSECMKKKQDMKEGKKGKSRKEKGASANVAADTEIAGQEDFAFTSDAKDTALIV